MLSKELMVEGEWFSSKVRLHDVVLMPVRLNSPFIFFAPCLWGQGWHYEIHMDTPNLFDSGAQPIIRNGIFAESGRKVGHGDQRLVQRGGRSPRSASYHLATLGGQPFSRQGEGWFCSWQRQRIWGQMGTTGGGEACWTLQVPGGDEWLGRGQNKWSGCHGRGQ